MLKNIFLTDLFAIEKKVCDNLVDKFDNRKKCVIDFINIQMIKIIWLVELIQIHNYCNLNWGIYMIYHEVQKIDSVKCVLVCVYNYQAEV